MATPAEAGSSTEVPAGKFLAAGGDGKQTTGALPKMKFELPLRLDCNTKTFWAINAIEIDRAERVKPLRIGPSTA
jgi:hypothetical protein